MKSRLHNSHGSCHNKNEGELLKHEISNMWIFLLRSIRCSYKYIFKTALLTNYIQNLIHEVSAVISNCAKHFPASDNNSKHAGCFTKRINTRDHNYPMLFCCLWMGMIFFPLGQALKFILLNLHSNLWTK